MSDIFDGPADARAFCDEVEAMLRAGDAEAALGRVRGMLTTLAQGGSALAARCLAAGPERVTVAGWAGLAGRVAALDRPGKPITAIGIDLSDPGAHSDTRPDAAGRMDPYIETNFYSDDAFPFSRSDRNALLDGYVGSGSKWQGSFVDIDNMITVQGLGDVYGPVYALEQAHARSSNGGPDFDMAVVGSSHIAVLVHLAVRNAVRRHGLPRPLAVLVGSNESYPYLDAPVITTEEYRATVAPVSPTPVEPAIADVSASTPGQSGTSLRRSIAASADSRDAPMAGSPPRAGLIARLFGRG